MADIRVKPARAGMRMRHVPSGTELPDEGGLWPADSFTFRRIVDGDLERLPDVEPSPVVPAAPAPASPVVPTPAPSPAAPAVPVTAPSTTDK